MKTRFFGGGCPRRMARLLFLFPVLGLTLCQCQVKTRAAAPPSPHPYFPIEPGSAWTLQLTLWEYPSRFDSMPLVFAREEFFRIVSMEQEPEGWTIHTEPSVASLLFLGGFGLEQAELVQDAEGFWLREPAKKKGPGLLLLPASPSAGQTWSAPAPTGLEVQCRVLTLGEPFSAGPGIEVDDALGLEIVFASEGQAERRVLWLGRGLGPLSLEAYAGSRLTDRWQRTDFNPFIRQP